MSVFAVAVDVGLNLTIGDIMIVGCAMSIVIVRVVGLTKQPAVRNTEVVLAKGRNSV